MKRFSQTFLLLIFLLNTAMAQTIEGYVYEKHSSQTLSGIQITVTQENEATHSQSNTTDINGYYFLSDINTALLGIENLEQLSWQFSGNQLNIRLQSKTPFQEARLFDSNGRLLAQNKIQTESSNIYTTSLDLESKTAGIYLLQFDASKALKIQATPANTFSQKFKNKTATYSYTFSFIDTQDIYANLDTLVEQISTENTNNLDFYLTKWPEFFANLYLNFMDKFGNKLKNTAIEVDETNGLYSFDLQTDQEGNIQVTDISIDPTIEDRLKPDSLDFNISITGDEYLEDFQDVIKKVSHGDFIKNYDNLTPKQQEFLANIYLNFQDKFGNKLTNTTIEVDETNGLYSFDLQTDQEGNIEILNESVPPINEITPDSMNFAINIKGDSYIEDFNDTIKKVSHGDFIKNYDNLTPKQQEFLATIYATAILKETGQGIEGVNGSLRKINETPTNQTTNVDGIVQYDLDIDPVNEITAGENKVILELAKEGLETIIDTFNVTNETYNRTYEMVEEEVEQAVATLYRKFLPEVSENETYANIVVENLEFNVNDTIFDIARHGWWQDTVPVHREGNTEYKITYLPRVREGAIPLYKLEKTLSLQAGNMSYGEDIVKALEQEQTILGNIKKGFDNVTLTGDVDVIVWNEDHSQRIDSVRTQNGNYRITTLPAGFEGWMDIHIPESNPESENYNGHKGIPIVPCETNTYPVNGGPIEGTTKVINFADSTITYNPSMEPTYWTDGETGELAKVNPAHIFVMNGNNNHFVPFTNMEELNVYLYPGSNEEWFDKTIARINRNYFGLNINVNKVSEQLPQDGVVIKSLDADYLNSIKYQMGINISVKDAAGITNRTGGGDVDGVILYSGANMNIRTPTNEVEGGDYSFEMVEDERELVHRLIYCTNQSKYLGIGNESTPVTLDTARMVYDHVNYSFINAQRKSRTNSDESKRTHTGSYTSRPNNDAEWYSSKSNSELYAEDKWKNWDTTNIPEFNLKFFEDKKRSFVK